MGVGGLRFTGGQCFKEAVPLGHDTVSDLWSLERQELLV